MPKTPTSKEFTDPCWKGYQMVGMKTQNGKEVPNCVPEESDVQTSTPADREWGTDSLVSTYKQMTPGETHEAWERNPNCQQCKHKLSTTELKRGDRICSACVKQNKGRVWGKDSDDTYEEAAYMTVPSFKHFMAEAEDQETVTVASAKPGELVSEVTPPGMEDWVKKNKARFHKQYGDRGDEILYATAWDMYEKGKRVDEAVELVVQEASDGYGVSYERLRDQLKKIVPELRAYALAALCDHLAQSGGPYTPHVSELRSISKRLESIYDRVDAASGH